MYQPITISELANFLQMVIYAFEDTLIMPFVIMLTFTVAYHVKRIIVDDAS